MANSALLENQFKFSKDVSKLIEFIYNNGYTCSLGEAHRTAEQQEIYLKKKLTKTRNSNHLKRLAIDLFIFKNGNLLSKKQDLQFIADYWTGLSVLNRWGGNFKSLYDAPHFERNI